MGFSAKIRERALLACARRCCVCHRFKGVNIEVHHIVPAAKGGSDNWENAIPLCFDCHSAAGHYNADHSKGTKYSPEELRGHREKLYANVADGRVPAADAAAIAGVHVRRLVFLSYTQAREMLNGTLQSPHFKFGPLIQNTVSKFMQTVLADELPLALNPAALTGTARPGVVFVKNYWKTRSELVAALPEFQALDERAVEQRDFRDGAIGSKLLVRSVAAGLSPAQIGVLKIQHNLCAEETWSVEYRVRRPLFVFTLIENLGTEVISVENVTGVQYAPLGLAPRAVAFPAIGTDKIEIAAVVLPPGHSMVVPTAVLLSPAEEDDLSFEWVDMQGHGDSVPYTAYSDEQSRLGSDAYLQVGPSFTVTATDILAGGNVGKFEAPLFDLKRVYLLGDALMAGSCPHVLVEFFDGRVMHLGEVLIGAWKQNETQVIVMGTSKNSHSI